MKVWIQKVKYQKDTGLCSWIVLQNLQEGFSEIFIFSFAIYVVFILNCGSLLLFLSCVVITHLFFIFSVVNHLELREISTSQSDLGSSLYATPVPVSGIWVEHALLMAFLLVASAILFVTRSESSFPVAIKAFHYLDVPWFIVLTLLLAQKQDLLWCFNIF